MVPRLNELQETSSYVNIEERLDEPYEPKAAKSPAAVAKAGSHSRKLTDDEIREMRKKQQERAMRAVTDINKYIKDDLENLHSQGDADEEEEEEKEEEMNAYVDFKKKLRKEIEELNIEEPLPSPEASEKSERELKNLMDEYSRTVDRANNEIMAKVLNAQAPSSAKETKKKAVHFQSDELQQFSQRLDRDNSEDEEDDEEEEEDYYDDEDLEGIDQEPDSDDEPKAPDGNTCVIKVKHTNLESASARVLSNSSVPKIESPADIYKVFYQPKSILKVKENQTDESTMVSMRIAQSANDVLKSEKNKENEDSFKFEPQKVSLQQKYGLCVRTASQP